jgi:hypothetical protein
MASDETPETPFGEAIDRGEGASTRRATPDGARLGPEAPGEAGFASCGGGGYAGGDGGHGGSRAEPGRGAAGRRARSGIGEYRPGGPAEPAAGAGATAAAGERPGMTGMPMGAGAGAGGGRDSEHKAPDYLRGRHLPDSDEIEYDRNGNVIIPYGVDAIEWLNNQHPRGW